MQIFESHTMGHESLSNTSHQADEHTLVAVAPHATQDRPRKQAP